MTRSTHRPGWSIPERGGYSRGCFAEQAAATAYLKYMRECHLARDRWTAAFLQSMVGEMIGWEKLLDAKRGHGVGFPSTLCDLLARTSDCNSYV